MRLPVRFFWPSVKSSDTGSDTNDGLRHAENLGAPAGDFQCDRGQSVGDVLHDAGDLDFDASVVIGYDEQDS